MHKTPQAIIADFEHRRRMTKITRRKKIHRRIFDVARVAIAPVAFFVLFAVLAPERNEQAAVVVGVLVLIYSCVEVQKRWVLEDRIEELERKMGSD